ncbi:MAG: glycoside hydrolase family 43 protein [Cyclobacteriaceae bacterium]|nr:glycoside hydrolase family 43 protein [Cyclobacteriaceae bacterium SS2]
MGLHWVCHRRNENSWGEKSFWAPEVIVYNDRFYMIYSSQGQTIFGKGLRLCIAVSDHPEGPFTDLYTPLFDFGYGTIDGHIFIEDDSPYLYFEMVGAVGNFTKQDGFLWGAIFGVELSRDLSKPIHEPKLCISPSQPWEGIESFWARSNEGMTVFKNDSLYYMTYSGNHYRDPNYGVGYATSKRPVGGLWTKYEGNPILKNNLSIGVSGPGHNSIVTSPDGSELFIVYHSHADAVNPSGKRILNIDRLTINPDGILNVEGPTRLPQPMPR